MKTLHYIPAPYLQESPSSLLRRIALNNGFSTVNRFCIRTNLTIGVGLLFQKGNFHLLLQKEYPEIDYLAAFYKEISFKRGHLIDIGGCDVPSKQLNCRGSGICTECLKTGWEPIIKDLRCVEYCPTHLRRYLFSCPECHIKFTPFTQLNASCICGASLSCEIVTEATAELELNLNSILTNNNQSVLDNFFFALTKLKYRNKTYTGQTSRILALCAMDIALGHIIKAYIRLNTSFHYPSTLSHRAIIAQLTHASRQPIPPTTFANLKSPHLVNSGEILGITFSKEELFTMCDISSAHWLTKIFASFKKNTQGRYTGDEVIEIYNLCQTNLHYNMEELAASVSVAQAKKMLDIPKSLVIKLYRLGHLKKLHDKSLSTRISQSSITIIHDKYISIWAISKLLKIRIATAQNAVIESGASYLDQPEESTPYLIDRNSINIVHDHLTQATCYHPPRFTGNLRIPAMDSPHMSQLITFKEACKRLTYNAAELHLLISNGLFKTYGRRKLFLKSADISSFKRKFATLRLLKKTTELRGNYLMEVLNSLRVPTATFRYGRSSITIFKRSDIKNINFQNSCEFAFTGALYPTGPKFITFNQARIELGIGTYELSKLAREIIHRRPLAYQSSHFKKAFTLKEFDELKETILESAPLEAMITECGLSRIQILMQFKIIQNKEVFYLNRIAHIKKTLALDVKFYYGNYISIYTAAININISPTLLLKLSAKHCDPNPYLKNKPSIKCLSAGHLDFLYKLILGHPENFTGPIKLI